MYAFEFFVGVTICLVPDNLRSGETKAHLYDPDINRTYQELADHYSVAVIPTRIRTPKDKPKVDVGVQGIQRWILAPLRDITFFSVHEINKAIKPLLTAYNERAFYERFALLIEREHITRENRKLTNRLRQAKLKEEACIEDINYTPERNLSKTVITCLAECSWIAKKENILITGPTGAGKTYLACAFANQACRQGYGARYIRLPKLFQSITIAKADGSYIKLMEYIAKLPLLVLDDWGIAPMNDANRRDLLEIIDDRYHRSSQANYLFKLGMIVLVMPFQIGLYTMRIGLMSKGLL